MYKTENNTSSGYVRNIRRSFGIACCKHNADGRMEILLVKKRYTYSFVSFVFGQYSERDTKRMRFLFNGMTRQEKIDISSRRFDYMWYKIWLEFPDVEYTHMDFKSSATAISNSLIALKEQTSSNFINCNSNVISKLDFYLKKKAKFERCFMGDGKKLERLLQGTSSVDLTWEIPKGRKKRCESEMDCAIREFKEETGIDIDRYNIMFNIKPIKNSHVSMNIEYTQSYYLGYATKDIYPNQQFEYNNQLAEIDSVKWVSFENLKFIDPDGRLTNTVKTVFDVFKSKYKRISVL